jgi:hypothetical protein
MPNAQCPMLNAQCSSPIPTVTIERVPASNGVEGALDTQPYITCRQLIDFISAYRDNELPGHERVEFERHLAVCPSCVAYLGTYEKTVALARKADTDLPPADVPESLIEAILAARHGTRS